ncbi:MAG: 30S ribosomal protein S16 [Planctomycetes bacterium]|nr:30S ribosomal protein S16 [Planctomycetota bacterium]
MAVVVRCQRLGRKNRPFFRVVAADERAKSDGRVVEIIGTYDPIAKDDKRLTINVERAQYWVSVGAILTETCQSLLKESGVVLRVKKRRVRTRPAGKKGLGGTKRKPARFKKEVGRLKRAAAKAAAAAAASNPAASNPAAASNPNASEPAKS